LYEYQNKGLMEFAFRKRLILKGDVFCWSNRALGGKNCAENEKREQAPAVQM
jgi:hypothetical protein